MAKDKPQAQRVRREARIIGVDPGLDGGIAIIAQGCGANGYERVHIAKMPTWEEIKDRKRRRYFDPIGFTAVINSWRKIYEVNRVIVENVHASPQMGVASSFSFGRTFGGILGCLGAGGYDVRLVEPSVWKRRLGLGASKVDAIKLAKQTWPTVQFGSHDGVAEAALIALYGIEHAPEVDPLS